MTGLAPISDAAVVGVNSAVAANSGARFGDSQQPADFSTALNAAANPPQSAPREAPGKNALIPAANSTRPQKNSSAQTNVQTPAVPARGAAPVATPVLTVSALLAHAAAPFAPPVPSPDPPPAAEAPNFLSAASDSPATENAATAAQAVVASAVPAFPTSAILSGPSSPLDAADDRIAITAASTATLAADDFGSTPAGTTQSTALDGNVSVAAGASEARSAADAELATIVSSAAGSAATVSASQVASGRAGAAQRDSTTAAATATATSATASTAKATSLIESTAKVEMPQPALVVPPPAPPRENSGQPTPAAARPAPPATRNASDNRPICQTSAGETVSANFTTASATLQKAISDARDNLEQGAGANLQAEISAAPGKAVSSADAATGTGANLAQPNSGNSSFNAGAQDLLQQYGDPVTSIAPGPSGISSDQAALSGNTGVSVVGKASSLATAALDSPVTHVMADAAPQAVSTSAPLVASQAPSTNSASAARPEPPPPSQQPLPQSLPQSLNDVAKASELYQRVGGSEMHVAMETELLGAVDLRATMHQSALTATIGVQRSDVQALLSNELPALQHALADKNFHVEQISVLNNSVGDRAGSSGQQQAATQNQNQHQNPLMPRAGYLPNIAASAASGANDLRAIAGASSMAHAWSDDSGRISVHV
jgi:hypothetical protein